MKHPVVLALALALTAFPALGVLVGCGPSAPPVTAPAKPVAPAKPAPPPCPESIVPGGDPLEAESFEGKPVVRVCVLGGTTESRAAAQRVIDLRPSDVFSADRVRADLEAILKLGTFDDASAYGLRVQQDASVVLFYSVHDRPLIADIGFEGAKVFGDATLDAKLPIHKNAPYDPAAINAVAQAVHDEYLARGYQAATVSLASEPVGTSVRVRIKVFEGPLWHYSRIDFRGVKKVPEADLRKGIDLKVGQPVVQDEIARTTLALSALYYDRGYVQMHIEPETAKPDPSGALALTFVVDEGDVHTLSGLHVTRLGAPFEKELLEKVMKSRPKQVFSRSKLVEDIQRVQAFFQEKGKKIEVTPLTEIDMKKHTIDLTIQIDEAH